MGLCDWKVASLVPTPRDRLEFYVVLSRLPRGGHWTEEMFVDEPQPGRMPDWLQETTDQRAELENTVDDLQRIVKTRDRELKAARRALAELEDRDRRRTSVRAKRAIRRLPMGAETARIYRIARKKLRARRG